MLGVQPYRTHWFMPHYRERHSGDWSLRISRNVLTRGYWSPPMLVEEMPVLQRGSDTWMSLTPMEIESQEIGVALSRGHVAVMGFGMG